MQSLEFATKKIEKGFRKINIELPVYMRMQVSGFAYYTFHSSMAPYETIDLNEPGFYNAIYNNDEFNRMCNAWAMYSYKGIQLKYRPTHGNITSRIQIVSMPDIAFAIIPADRNTVESAYNAEDIWNSDCSYKVMPSSIKPNNSYYWAFPKCISTVQNNNQGTYVPVSFGSETYQFSYAVTPWPPISISLGYGALTGRVQFSGVPFNWYEAVGSLEVTVYIEWTSPIVRSVGAGLFKGLTRNERTLKKIEEEEERIKESIK